MAELRQWSMTVFLQDPKVDFAIGMHVSSAKPVGYVAIEPGPITAYPDFFLYHISRQRRAWILPQQGE